MTPLNELYFTLRQLALRGAGPNVRMVSQQTYDIVSDARRYRFEFEASGGRAIIHETSTEFYKDGGQQAFVDKVRGAIELITAQESI